MTANNSSRLAGTPGNVRSCTPKVDIEDGNPATTSPQRPLQPRQRPPNGTQPVKDEVREDEIPNTRDIYGTTPLDHVRSAANPANQLTAPEVADRLARTIDAMSGRPAEGPPLVVDENA